MRKSFGDEVVLRDVDLVVPEHTVTVLIGASGSGKSTLLRCVNQLEQVDDGVVLFDGVDITDPRIDHDDVRQRMGIVFQAFNLFPHMTVLDNITLAPRKVHKVPRAEAEKRGLDPNLWFGNVEQIASERIGRETVTYVSNIYKYYIAYKLVADQRARRDEAMKSVKTNGK